MGSTLRSRLRDSRMRLAITLAIFLGINFILLALYLWSRGGQTVHVQVIANGDEFTAFIDGKKMAVARFAGLEQGGIQLALGASDELPSLPKPRGIDSIRVTDLSNGKVLFEDDFSDGPAAEWKANGQNFILQDGVLGASEERNLTLSDRPWTNYVVDMTFKNPSAGALRVRTTANGSGVEYGFRPLRHYDNGFTRSEAGRAGQYVPGPPIELDRFGTVESLLAMALRTYPYIFPLLAAGFILVAALQFVGPVRLPVSIQQGLVFRAAYHLL